MTYSKGFTPKNLDLLRTELTKLLSGIDPSLTHSLGKMTYTDGEVGLKLTLNIKGKKTQEELDFDRYCDFYKLDKSLSKDVESFGPCKLIGYKTRSRKMPWLIQNKSGKVYKITQELALSVWGTRD